MGHFTHNCKLTGLPITGGQPAVLIVMKPQHSLYDNSEEHLQKYGSTYMCSNDGPRLKYFPVWFPIKGDYNDYGGMEDIIEDVNTNALEEYYGLTIQDLMNIITSGRKDDGYDESLKVIKKPIEYPSDWVKDEKHIQYYSRTQNDPQPFDGRYPQAPGKKFKVYRDGKYIEASKEEYDADYLLINEHYQRYNTWKENNPDPEDDYNKPQYQERYKELLSLSGMWVHGKVYEELTKENFDDSWDKLDLGNPGLLKSLGFIQGDKVKRERYDIPFIKDGLTIYSDGNWIDVPNESIYRLKDLKKYCEKKGVTLDISEHENKDRIEQIFDYVIPDMNMPKMLVKPTQEQIDAKKEGFRKLFETKPELSELFGGEEGLTDENIIDMLETTSSFGRDHTEMLTAKYFLNNDRFGSSRISNPMTFIYLNMAKEGKLRSNVVEFARFDSYMYACGKYYEIVGTGPQDGDHKKVMKVLDVAKSVLQEIIDERYSDYDDDDE
jgi:hypothetical protein